MSHWTIPDHTKPFNHKSKVRYAETDLQGIVCNANYLTDFDIGVHEFFQSLPYDYTLIGRETGMDFNMAMGKALYHRPLRLDEVFAVGISVARVGRSSLTFDLAIQVGDEQAPRATGEIVSVHADQTTNRSGPLPQSLLRLLAARGDTRTN